MRAREARAIDHQKMSVRHITQIRALVAPGSLFFPAFPRGTKQTREIDARGVLDPEATGIRWRRDKRREFSAPKFFFGNLALAFVGEHSPHSKLPPKRNAERR